MSCSNQGRCQTSAPFFSELHQASRASSTLMLHNGDLVADSESFLAYGHLLGKSPLRWRSGVKHDCSQVIELRYLNANAYQNGLGEVVSLESTHLYPMLKGSDLTKSHCAPSRFMLVTQKTVGEDTSHIAQDAPQTWQYLQSHAERFDKRRSSIYKDRPRFSMFGVGPYTFAPWKVAISGFAKQVSFHCIKPFEGKPILFDDTCYFLPCETYEDAQLLTELLNSKTAKGFLQSVIFWDAKRPITAQILGKLDLQRLSEELEVPLPLWSDGTVGKPRLLL